MSLNALQKQAPVIHTRGVVNLVLNGHGGSKGFCLHPNLCLSNTSTMFKFIAGNGPDLRASREAPVSVADTLNFCVYKVSSASAGNEMFLADRLVCETCWRNWSCAKRLTPCFLRMILLEPSWCIPYDIEATKPWPHTLVKMQPAKRPHSSQNWAVRSCGSCSRRCWDAKARAYKKRRDQVDHQGVSEFVYFLPRTPKIPPKIKIFEIY
jgi:hypothetical protein